MAFTDDEVLLKLQETRDAIIITRLSLIATPKPSYNIDGQEVKWNEYLAVITRQLAALNAEINILQPFEIEEVYYPEG